MILQKGIQNEKKLGGLVKVCGLATP